MAMAGQTSIIASSTVWRFTPAADGRRCVHPGEEQLQVVVDLGAGAHGVSGLVITFSDGWSG